MKKYFVLVLVFVVLAVFAVPAFALGADIAPVAQVSGQEEAPAGDLALPVDLEDLITVFVGLLVTQGLKSVSKLIGKDISGWAAAITASVAMSVVFFFNALLSAVPATAQPSVAVGLTLIVTVLASFGLKDTLKGFQAIPARK